MAVTNSGGTHSETQAGKFRAAIWSLIAVPLPSKPMAQSETLTATMAMPVHNKARIKKDDQISSFMGDVNQVLKDTQWTPAVPHKFKLAVALNLVRST